MGALRIASGPLSAVVVPELGGGLARFDHGEGVAAPRFPLFRPWPDDRPADPLTLGLIVLVPWSNRVTGGGVHDGTMFHELPRNLAHCPYPVHGNGFQSAWTVVAADPAAVRLSLVSDGPGPYRYAATLGYALSADGLAVSLAVTNRGDRPLPFGIGFHPWLTRTPGMTLRAPARTVWSFDAAMRVGGSRPVPQVPDLDFGVARPVPAGAVANWFTGWDGAAAVVWPEAGLALDVTATPTLRTYLLYSPGPEAGFLCLEPVSHGVDAHTVAYAPEDGPLTVLAPGASLEGAVTFAVRRP